MHHSLSRYFLFVLLVMLAACGSTPEFVATDSSATSTRTPASLENNIYQEAQGATYTVDGGRGTLRLQNALRAVQVSPGGDVFPVAEAQLLAALQSCNSIELLTRPDQDSQRFVTGRVRLAQRENLDVVIQFEGNPPVPPILGEVLLLGRGAVPNLTAADALAATSEPGTIYGEVTNANTGDYLAGARVEANGPKKRTTTTDWFGRYQILTEPGTYEMTVSTLGFETQTRTVNLSVNGGVTRANFALNPVPLPHPHPHRLVQQAPTGRLEVGQSGNATLTLQTPFSPSLIDGQGEARKLGLSEVAGLIGPSNTNQKTLLHVIDANGARSENIGLLEARLVAGQVVCQVMLPVNSHFTSGALAQVTLSVTR